MKDVTEELNDATLVQESSSETVHCEQTEAILRDRARNNFHFILSISPVSPAQT